MARVFLHIGVHKTGTSYLQAMLFDNRALLARHGIIYPDLGPHKGHHILTAPWLNLREIPKDYLKGRDLRAPWHDIVRKYAKVPGTVLLSSETFSTSQMDVNSMREVAELLSSFEEVHIVYTMRQQAELVQSMWMQVAKTHKVLQLRAFVSRALKERRCTGVRIDHSTVYANLRANFHTKNIHILDYNSMRRSPGGIIGTFLRLLGSDLEAAALASLKSSVDANISPDPVAFYMATEIANGQVPSAQLVNLLAQVVHGADPTPSTLLTHGEYHKLRGRFIASNEKLMQQARETQPDFLFDPGKVPKDLFYRDDLTAEHWKQAARAVFATHHDAAATDGSLFKRLLHRT